MSEALSGILQTIGQIFASSGVQALVEANPLVAVLALGVVGILAVDLILGAPWSVWMGMRALFRRRRSVQANKVARELRRDSGARFAALVAPFAKDRDEQLGDLINQALNDHMGAFMFERDVLVEHAPLELEGAQGEDAARAWLAKSEADLLVWGEGGKGSLHHIFFLTGKSALAGEPVQEIRFVPAQIGDELASLAAGIAYIFARTALPSAQEADRYRVEKLVPLLDALGALARDPPHGLGSVFEQVLRRDAASIALSVGRRRGDPDELRRASRLRVRIVAEIDRAREPVSWAVARADLGRTHLALGQLELDDKRLGASVAALSEAAEMLKGEETRDLRAGVLLDLAHAHHERAKMGDPALNFAEAAKAYRRALKVAPDDVPGFLDSARRGLAETLHALADIGGDIAALRQAIEAYRDAATDRARAVDPLGWAMIRHRLGDALMSLAVKQGDNVFYREAIEAYQSALRERPRDSLPDAWADTWSQLGHALLGVGKAEPDLDALHSAVDAFRNALKEIDVNDDPFAWSQLQNNLGNAQQAIGEATGERRPLVSAITAYRNSLEHIDKHERPFDWAGTQNNLGNALHVLGEKSQGVEALEAALTAHRNALTVRTRESARVDWAATRNNMGLVLTTLGTRLRDAQRLEDAVDAYRDAVGVFRMSGVVRFAVMAERNLDKAKAVLEECRQLAAE